MTFFLSYSRLLFYEFLQFFDKVSKLTTKILFILMQLIF